MKTRVEEERGNESYDVVKRLVFAVLLACLVLSVKTGKGFTCNTAQDCELNGRCNLGTCECKAGWKGSTCGTLDVGSAVTVWPPENEQQGIRVNTSTYSWGFSSIQGNDGLYHGFVDMGCYLCEYKDVDGTYIGHVVSNEADGPYILVDMAVPINSFNPQVIASKSLQGYVLQFRTNTGSEGWQVCTAGRQGTLPQKTNASEWIKRKGMNTAFSTSLYGPWAIAPLEIVGWEHIHVSNPSILELENGTALMAYRFNLPDGEHVGIARSESVLGPFQHITNLSIAGEDPFLWQDQGDGSFHMLFHVEDYRVASLWPSLHAFSKDGLTWSVSSSIDHVGAYSTEVQFKNGSTVTFHRRERPQIVFDRASGRPMRLFSAVQHKDTSPPCKWPYALSISQEIKS